MARALGALAIRCVAAALLFGCAGGARRATVLDVPQLIGRVVDETGSAVPHADVHLVHGASSAAGAEVCTVRTRADAAGCFAITAPADPPYLLWAAAAGAMGWLGPVGARQDLVLRVEPARAESRTLRDMATGALVPGLSIRVRIAVPDEWLRVHRLGMPPWIVPARSGTDGGLSFQVPAGARFELAPDASSAARGAGATLLDHGDEVVVLTMPPAEIAGSVRDAAGEPLAGVAVFDVADPTCTTRTAGDGTFTLAAPSGSAVVRSPEHAVAVVTAGAPHARLAPGVPVTVHLVAASGPLVGAPVRWVAGMPRARPPSARSVAWTERLDGSGRVATLQLHPGEPIAASVLFEGEWVQFLAQLCERPIDRSPFRISNDGAIRGRVLGAGGRPPEYAVVLLRPEFEDAADGSAELAELGCHRVVTDAEGCFAVAGLLPGRYRIGVDAPGLWPWSQLVDASAEAPAVELRPAAGPTIAGRLVDANGAPLARRIVAAFPRAVAGFVADDPFGLRHPIAITDDAGRFSFAGLPSAVTSYELRARQDGASATASVTRGDQDVLLRFER